jgi:voltage-gated potassium channel
VPLYTSTAPDAGRRKFQEWRRRAARAAALLASALVGCMAGLLLLDGSGDPLPSRAFRALWNASNTISTLGDLDSLNHAQQVFMVGAMFVFVSIGGYAVSTLTGVFSSDDVQAYREYRRMEKTLEKLAGHVVVAGFGPIGRRVAESLRRQGKDVVVVEFDEDRARQASAQGYLAVLLTAGRDEALTRTRLDTAEAFVVIVADADRKLALTMIARGINPKLRIVVTDDSDAEESWLPHAGASEVVLVDDLVARAVLAQLTPPAAS